MPHKVARRLLLQLHQAAMYPNLVMRGRTVRVSPLVIAKAMANRAMDSQATASNLPVSHHMISRPTVSRLADNRLAVAISVF
jgi:hypothetical protein